MKTRKNVPELSGLSTYAGAARVGWSVEENVQRLLRLHWTERRLMNAMLAHFASTPEWEVKCGLALHQWQSAEHAGWLRARITEMRHPAPPLDEAPDAALDAFLEEVLRAENTRELLTAIYGVALPALREAYYEHIEHTNPLVDHPTVRFMRFAMVEVTDALEWGARARDALTATDETVSLSQWRQHLEQYLDAAQGIAGDPEIDLADGDDRRGSTIRAMKPPLPPPRARGEFAADFWPARDDRFQGLYNFEFPPQLVYNDPSVPADERNLALLCKRTLEMDVPEAMASFLYERKDQPWEFYADYSRQLWDEARHAMMGTVALEALGIDWKKKIPLNVGFSLRLNLHASPQERQILLYAIEQSLMPAETGKKFEFETAVAASDELSAHFHDYDWADEVLHAQIGRRALRREGISREEAIRRGEDIHRRTWAALDSYRSREPQSYWWPDFVKETLGRETAFIRTGQAIPGIFGE